MLRQRISSNNFWSSGPTVRELCATGREYDAATAASAADVMTSVRMAAKAVPPRRVYFIPPFDPPRLALIPRTLTSSRRPEKIAVMRLILVAASVALYGFALSQTQLPSSLDAMVNAERAFARSATQKGIRDSFLEFFADDAIAFTPRPVSATERLRSRPSRPFSELELTWEPRTGDIAASGELGWLTGPSTFIDHTTAGSAPQPGNYLSVWRRRANGPWRVFIDVGSQPPQAVSFDPGFTRFPVPSRYAGAETGAAATASLLDVDKRLNAQIADRGPGPAYEAVVTGGSRLHRSGFMPAVGPQSIRSWLDGNASSMTASTGSAESAESGDLGYSYGTYEVKGMNPQSGAYVRIWQRDSSGKWLLVADVLQKT